MSPLLDMPEVLLTSLLSDWLTIDDVAFMDSAYCNAGLRPVFMTAAYRSGAVFQYTCEIIDAANDFCNAMNGWTFAKDAAVNGFRATDIFWESHSRRSEYLAKHGDAIRWIQYLDESQPCSCSESKQPQHCSFHILSAINVAKKCPKLTCFHSTFDLSLSVAMALAQNCPLLEDLTLHGPACDSASIFAIAEGCKNLKRVDFFNIDDLQEQALVALVRSNTTLQEVNISADGNTSEFVRELALNCRDLTDLTLYADDLNLDSTYFLLKHCSKLASLAYNQSPFLPAKRALAPVTSSSMRHLHLSEVDIAQSELRSLLRACPGLICLQLDRCEPPLNLGALHVGKHCPRLQSLRLMEKDSVGGDAMLLDVAKHCRDLRNLNASPNTSVTDMGLCAVARKCAQLQDVAVGASTGVTDCFLTTLAKHCHQLADLTIGNCAGVTQAGIEAVLQGCPELTKLSVSKDLIAAEDEEDWVHSGKKRYPNVQHVYGNSW